MPDRQRHPSEKPGMYGILITAMLTTGSGAPGFGRPHNWFGGSGCSGCTGCSGCCGGYACCGGCTGFPTPPVRLFRTPELKPDRDYYYPLAVEVVRGGKTVKSPAQRVIVRAGSRANVTIADPGVGGTARIKVRVPEGAQLYVEGSAWPTGGGPTAIVTAVPRPGKQYVYAG